MTKKTIDSKVVELLMDNGRMSWADLGEQLGLSAPAAADRVHRLEKAGVIRGFTALVQPEAAGFPVLAFVSVTLVSQNRRTAFMAGVRKLAAIQECHHVAGDDDYLLKVRCRTMGELDELLSRQLKGRLGVARTRTTITLGTAKETTRLPLTP